MIDLGRLAESVGSLLGGNATEQVTGDLMSRLSEIGVDPSMFEGLDATQIVERLNELGIDLGNIDPTQLTNFVEQFQGGDLASGAMNWLSERFKS